MGCAYVSGLAGAQSSLTGSHAVELLVHIPDFGVGGAQRQAILLVNALARRGRSVGLAVYCGQGELRETVSSDVTLIEMEKRGRRDNLLVLVKLAAAIRRFRPRVLYGMLTLPNIFGTILRPFFPRLTVISGMRASNINHGRYGLAARFMVDLERILSPLAHAIIVNSEAGRLWAEKLGFPTGKLRVVPNGIDTSFFRPQPELGQPLREKWGIAPNVPLVGLVARLDPMKDHSTFLRAAALLLRRVPGCRFVCVGQGPEEYATGLRQLAGELSLSDRLIWAGLRRDTPAVYNALDVLCLTSAFGEGFSNVLGEAMACGTVCVATDVGDAARILGPVGRCVPCGSPEAVAEGVLEVLRLQASGQAEELAQASRERIIETFELERMIDLAEREITLQAACVEAGWRGGS